ncbi:MAG TPA: hypothetical protein DCM28_00035 [Phycisphaerales bacterium]|nr:hypothetical protein [Phycisphaerales bacterium]
MLQAKKKRPTPREWDWTPLSTADLRRFGSHGNNLKLGGWLIFFNLNRGKRLAVLLIHSWTP